MANKVAEASKPEWFKGVPDAIGWYFFAGDYGVDEGRFVEVRKVEYPNRSAEFEMFREEWESAKSGRWYGPIRIPDLPDWIV